MTMNIDRPPKLSELQRLTLDPDVCCKWEDVGIALGLADEDDGAYLEELANIENGGDKKRMWLVFKKWLPVSKNKLPQTCSWKYLLQILKTHDLHGAADTMRDHLESLEAAVSTPLQACVIAPPQQGSLPLAVDPSQQPVPTFSLPISIPLLTPGPAQFAPSPANDVSNQLASSPITDSLLGSLPQPNVEPITKNYSIQMKTGDTVRKYQQELAEPGINGDNCIVIAPTGSGKTLVSALVISNHLRKNQSSCCCHVVFVVPTKPLADQQKVKLSQFIPDAKVGVYTGDTPDTVADSIRHKNNITVCTAGKLLDEIQNGQVKFDQISLIIFDECHHTKKRHPYALLMLSYLECRADSSLQTPLPQIFGMTASPGAGDNPELDKIKTIKHLLNLAAHLDATSGFHCVTENKEELQKHSKSSSISLNILPPREACSDPFISYVTKEMVKLEQSVPAAKNNFDRWSQKYETMIHQIKSSLESDSRDTRDEISTLDVLCCYSSALSIYMDLQQKDAIKVMKKFTGLPDDATKLTPHEREIKSGMQILVEKLSQLPLKDNPLLEGVKAKLCESFDEKPTSRAILFIRTKNHAYAVKEWVSEHPHLSDMIVSDVITGHRRETGPGMTQQEQKDVMDNFRKGKINLLIATSVAEEGLDVPECNLMIRYLHVTDEIARVQTEGRARAEGSQGITIVSSDSNKKFQELKNKELNSLIDEILEKKQFPTGEDLRLKLYRFQKRVIYMKKLKAAMKVAKRRSHESRKVELSCKKCGMLACFGSDVYKLCDAVPTEAAAEDKTSYHYVVPDPEFKKKIIVKPHHKPCDLIKDKVQKTHKIYCYKCENDWGVQCIWPTEGHEFPVLKCSSFIFKIEGVTRTLKKWSVAPFEIDHLSSWQYINSAPEISFSDSDTESD